MACGVAQNPVDYLVHIDHRASMNNLNNNQQFSTAAANGWRYLNGGGHDAGRAKGATILAREGEMQQYQDLGSAVRRNAMLDEH